MVDTDDFRLSVPAKPHIGLRKVKFRGTPIFGDDGEEFVQYEPGETRYVGEPSDEIDEAWNQLTKSEFSSVIVKL